MLAKNQHEVNVSCFRGSKMSQEITEDPEDDIVSEPLQLIDYRIKLLPHPSMHSLYHRGYSSVRRHTKPIQSIFKGILTQQTCDLAKRRARICA